MTHLTPTQTAESGCPFCAIEDGACAYADALVRAVPGMHPAASGDVLIVTRRHTLDWFAATAEERAALMAAAHHAIAWLERSSVSSMYTLKTIVGEGAAQQVPHAHLCVIAHLSDATPPKREVDRVTAAAQVAPRVGEVLDGAPHTESLIQGSTNDPLLPHLLFHLSTAKQVDIVVAFTLTSGVRLLVEHLRDVIARGGAVRVLTGDYLNVTEPEALRRLLDLGPSLELRVFVSAGTSFHLKSYICTTTEGTGTAFVGSSNLSQTALRTGVEWNYRVITSRDAEGFRGIGDGFSKLFSSDRTLPVDDGWISAYEEQRRLAESPSVNVSDSGVAPEPPVPVPSPHEVQAEALQALDQTRQAGNGAGLVVLATGLGKTWLAAFDSAQANARRVLFVAHREEILDQAIRTFRTIRPNAVLGKYTGTERHLDADCVFASVQTLGRRAHLNRFGPDHFDYVVVDEFHHASASTYRRLLEHFTPAFLLGLTATPERTDGADLLALCGENLVYRCNLSDGIRRGLLSPFDYYGVPDDVDYAQIPWRSARFDEDALSSAVATTRRADNAFEQLSRRGGARTLAFCVSRRHAAFMKQHFASKGRRVAAVHSGPESDPRARSLEALQAGEIDVLFAVDMFNEGVDLPDVDTVLMLRPTESSILWLQQFGRGLRRRVGKRLKVIDYIGNHRSFLIKPRTLFQLEDGDVAVSVALKLIDQGKATEMLPPGCSVTYDLEAKDILRQLLMNSGDTLESFYVDFKERTGARPTATEVFHSMRDPKLALKSHGSWFKFVRSMGDLTTEQADAEEAVRPFLSVLETTRMTRSFKMVLLLAMIAEEGLPGSTSVRRLVPRVRAMVMRSASLRRDFGIAIGSDESLVALLEQQPIHSWLNATESGGESFFAYSEGVFSTAMKIPPGSERAVGDLVRELAEWRLAVYLHRTRLRARPKTR